MKLCSMTTLHLCHYVHSWTHISMFNFSIFCWITLLQCITQVQGVAANRISHRNWSQTEISRNVVRPWDQLQLPECNITVVLHAKSQNDWANGNQLWASKISWDFEKIIFRLQLALQQSRMSNWSTDPSTLLSSPSNVTCLKGRDKLYQAPWNIIWH